MAKRRTTAKRGGCPDGHTGAIYLADNWQYVGLTKPAPTFTIDGVLTARKATRTRTRSELFALGAVHQGNHAKHKFVMVRTARTKKLDAATDPVHR